jgi:hypothetical protein
MEGIKSDRPEFIHIVFWQLIDDIKFGSDTIQNINHTLDELNNGKVPPEILAISLVLGKDPAEYEHTCKKSRLGTRLGLQSLYSCLLQVS